MTYLVLLTVVTSAELQASMLAAMQTAGLPTSSWSKSGLYQNLVNWFAILYQGLYGILRIAAENAFLDTATDQGLIDLGVGTFGTAYRGKTFATGTVTLLNNSGAPLEVAADGISFAKVGDPDVTYRNTGTVNILNGAQGTIDVQCDVAGTVGNAIADNSAPFQLELSTTLLGVTIVEHSAFVGQDDQEPDDYRALCRKQAGSLSPGGAKEAWSWFPLNLNTDGTISEAGDNKTRVNINRVMVDSDNANGIVNLSLASPSGPVDGSEFATTVAFLEQYVLTNPGTLVAQNCTAVPVNITASVTLRKGTSTSGVADEIEARLTEYFPLTSIGGDDGFLTREELRGEIFRANKNIHAVTVTIPGADVALTDTQVATLGTVTLSVTVQP